MEKLGSDGAVVCGRDDGRTMVLNVLAGGVVGEWETHDGLLKCIAGSRDGEKIISGSWDERVNVWGSGDGKQLRIFREHKGVVSCLALVEEDELAISGERDVVKVCPKAGKGRKASVAARSNLNKSTSLLQRSMALGVVDGILVPFLDVI